MKNVLLRWAVICGGCLIASTPLLAQPAAAPATAPATQPAGPPQDPRVAAPKTGQNGQRFMDLHKKFVERAHKGDVDLLFLGDSITEGWNKAPDVWKKNYEPLKVANFGIGGDRTQHVLWRIENGELDGISPKVVVLMIGTNNTNSDPADAIAEGVENIVKTIHAKLPSTKVLLLAVFPRNTKRDTVQQERINDINKQIAKLDDGGKTVRYLDIGAKFLGPDGKVPEEIMPDGLHPNPKGYQIWADAMQPTLDEMMKS